MNMQAMLMQAQRIQRELQKAKNELANKEFIIEKSGVVKVIIMGDRNVKSVSIDENAFNKEDKEMIEDLIVIAIKEGVEQVNKAIEEINVRFTGRKEGLGM